MANKSFSTMNNVGRARYVAKFHDGEKTHQDGSPFFDIHIETNKRRFNKFVQGLRQAGYVEQ